MPELKGSCIIAQSGGPTAVINASVLGIINTAGKTAGITQILGAVYGIKGVFDEQFYDLGAEDPAELELLRHTPSAVLGASRYKLAEPEEDDTDFVRILEVFKKRNVRYFFFCGGHDTMDACEKINRYMKSVGHDCRVIGIPKTIDNDLSFTDHAPGYGSAAKFVATTMMEISQDAKVYDTGMITVVEIMGRNAGWLAAAASLANEMGCGPDLIYLPERRFDMESFLSDVEAVYKKNGNALVAVSEGIRNKKGTYVMELAGHETARDVYGHAKMGGLASYLASLLKERTGAKVRGIELSLLQRCAAHLASATDVEEAYNLGCSAVNIAARGISGVMVALRRVNTSCYKIQYVFENLERVANYEHKMPKDWINESGNGVTCEFVEYALPLIAGDLEVPKEDALPRYARLKFIPA